jgi:hypothetical protein
MSTFIQDAVDKKYDRWEKGLQESFKNQTDRTKFTGEQLAAELKAARSVEKPTNWFMWKRAHVGRGVRATWKDSHFFTYIAREAFNSRSGPWVWSGISLYVFGYVLLKTPAEEHLNSPNFYPHGDPPGSRLNAHYSHLAHIDIGEPDLHRRGQKSLKEYEVHHH